MSRSVYLRVLMCWLLAVVTSSAQKSIRVQVVIDRGPDYGQSFGSLFEGTTADGNFVIGAGFPNAYNTRYRANRHSVQFFIRPVHGNRPLKVKQLPRPTDNLTGAYLFERAGSIYSTYGGLQRWDADKRDQFEVTRRCCGKETGIVHNFDRRGRVRRSSGVGHKLKRTESGNTVASVQMRCL